MKNILEVFFRRIAWLFVSIYGSLRLQMCGIRVRKFTYEITVDDITTLSVLDSKKKHIVAYIFPATVTNLYIHDNKSGGTYGPYVIDMVDSLSSEIVLSDKIIIDMDMSEGSYHEFDRYMQLQSESIDDGTEDSPECELNYSGHSSGGVLHRSFQGSKYSNAVLDYLCEAIEMDIYKIQKKQE